MVEDNNEQIFGDTPTVESDGVFKSAPINDSELESGQNFQARAKLTLSDGTEVFTDATTFETPGEATPSIVFPAPVDGNQNVSTKQYLREGVTYIFDQ